MANYYLVEKRSFAVNVAASLRLIISIKIIKHKKIRGKARRIELINLAGGKCSKCGYDKNYAALEFHHTKPLDKLFNLDVRKCSNSYIEDLVEESKKCILLCANCHVEDHCPNDFKS